MGIENREEKLVFMSASGTASIYYMCPKKANLILRKMRMVFHVAREEEDDLIGLPAAG